MNGIFKNEQNQLIEKNTNVISRSWTMNKRNEKAELNSVKKFARYSTTNVRFSAVS